jgi:hypothetical protein
MISMCIVGYDEWTTYGLLPRPARLWDTTKVFGMLAILSIVDSAVPLVNALAIGYTVMLGYNYYSSKGTS